MYYLMFEILLTINTIIMWNNLNERGKRCTRKKNNYLPVEYIDVETGEYLPKNFKEIYYYQFEKTIIKNESDGTVKTTRGVLLRGKKPNQLSIF